MVLSEQRIIKQVSILPSQNAINVQWANQIFRDGEIISETYERKAYSKEQISEFSLEVDGAQVYMTALGWNE